MKGVFDQTALLAVAADADNYLVPLAWAIMKSESESSWRYFLSHLKAACPCIGHENTVIMSDRDKGLIAADDGIPRAHRLYCVEHIGRR